MYRILKNRIERCTKKTRSNTHTLTHTHIWMYVYNRHYFEDRFLRKC